VKRELLIAVAAATTIAGVAGCSSGNKASGPSSSSTTSSSAATSSCAASSSSTPAAAGGETKVTIEGQPQNVGGPVVCATNNGRFSIAIGEAITGVIVGLEPDASVVHDVGLGTVNGVVLSFTEGAPGNNANGPRTATPTTSPAPPQVWTTGVSRSASRSRLTPPALRGVDPGCEPLPDAPPANLACIPGIAAFAHPAMKY
jgi:lipoprotein LpqH